VARINAADAYAPSMRQRLDVADPYAKARRAMPETVDGQPPLPVPQTRPRYARRSSQRPDRRLARQPR